jgi:hypothetical protein
MTASGDVRMAREEWDRLRDLEGASTRAAVGILAGDPKAVERIAAELCRYLGWKWDEQDHDTHIDFLVVARNLLNAARRID